MVKNIFKKGMTLVELILYMGLFALIILLVFSTTFYLQKLFEDKLGEYAIRRDVYMHLRILQEYLVGTERIELGDNSFIFYMKNDSLQEIRQTLENGKINMEYRYTDISKNKKFVVYELDIFDSFQLSASSSTLPTLYVESRVKALIRWKNTRHKELEITEFLTIPNHR